MSISVAVVTNTLLIWVLVYTTRMVGLAGFAPADVSCLTGRQTLPSWNELDDKGPSQPGLAASDGTIYSFVKQAPRAESSAAAEEGAAMTAPEPRKPTMLTARDIWDLMPVDTALQVRHLHAGVLIWSHSAKQHMHSSCIIHIWVVQV